MKRIALGHDVFAIVDDGDFALASAYAWHCSSGYATNKGRGVKTLLLHRLIMGATNKQFVDHRNRDPLDCRRENLRIATKSQNAQNSKRRRDNKSGFKGVGFDKRRKYWRSRLTINNKEITVGTFQTAREAALAYDAAARKHFGEFALVNFPEVV